MRFQLSHSRNNAFLPSVNILALLELQPEARIHKDKGRRTQSRLLASRSQCGEVEAGSLDRDGCEASGSEAQGAECGDHVGRVMDVCFEEAESQLSWLSRRMSKMQLKGEASSDLVKCCSSNRRSSVAVSTS